MTTISPVEIFIALFIGMGPIKVLLVYIAMTEEMSKETKRQVAKRTVLVAGMVGLHLTAACQELRGFPAAPGTSWV